MFIIIVFFAWARYLAFAPSVPSWAIAIVRLPSQLDFASVSLVKSIQNIYLHRNMINRPWSDLGLMINALYDL